MCVGVVNLVFYALFRGLEQYILFFLAQEGWRCINQNCGNFLLPLFPKIISNEENEKHYTWS